MKAGKIIRNVVLGLAGTVLALLVGLQITLRPKVLTGLVNGIAADLVEGDVAFREVKAHVIKSFPYLHLEAEDFTITYPHSRYARYDSLYANPSKRFNLLQAGNQVEGTGESLTDTLASFRRLDLSLNYIALLKGEYDIRNLELIRPRIFAHYYDSTAANWDILPLGGEESAEDTLKKPVPAIRFHKITLSDRPFIVFTHPEDTLMGLFTMRRMVLEGKTVSMDSLFVSGRLPADTVALGMERLRAGMEQRRMTLEADAKAYLRTAAYGRLQVPIHLDADASFPETAPGNLAVDIHRLKLGLSSIGLVGAGSFRKSEDGRLDMDLAATIKDCPLGDLIKEYQDNIPFLKKMDTDARISLDASVKGAWGDGLTPRVNARLLIPPATVDYEGLGRKGRLAVDASVTTDDLQIIHADIEKLFVDIVGARINLNGYAKDVLGEDPLIGLEGTIHARVDSLTRAFTREMGLEGNGQIDARISGRARLSELNAARIGNSTVNCGLTARDLYVELPSDSLTAQLPRLEVHLATKANSIDRNLPKGARVLALKADADTLDVNIGSMFVKAGGVRILMQNSANILRGGKELTALMGLLKVGNLRLKDEKGLSLGVRDNTETFRITPATPEKPSPRLALTSSSGRLRLRSGENMFALKDAKFDLAASRYIARRRPPQDSTRRLRRLPHTNDDFAKADIRINLGESLRKYVREWDIDGHLDLSGGRAILPSFPLQTRLEAVKGSFVNDTLKLQSITLKAGESDVTAQAQLTGLRRALIGRRRSRLKLKADVRSNYIDVNELLRGYAYHSAYSAPKTLSQASDEAVEKAVDQAQLPSDSTVSRLFVLPSNLDVDFSLEASGIKYDSLLINWAAADVAMQQRTLQITNAVAASNMGDIYFEGFYASRAKDDIKAGFDLNLVDITAEKVITLFPAVDSIMPMLTSFGGDLDCSLTATSDIDTLMNLVKPSINGIMKISGKDLTLKDSKEFTKIANMLMFRNRASAHIDEMKVTGMVRDNVLEVFPFVMNVDRYQLAASGIQHLNRQFNYHISVIRSPLLVKFGLNAWGQDFDDIHYRLGKAKYLNANVPAYSKQLDTVQFSLVAAIHNVFELGVEKALQENRTEEYLKPVSSLEIPNAPAETPASDSLSRVSALIEQVEKQTLNRREALKEEIVGLTREAALKKEEDE